MARMDKIISDLETLVDEQKKEGEIADAKIHEYTVKRNEADHEVQRAQRVRDNFAELVS